MTGNSPVEVHYGFPGRAIQEMCITWDSHSGPTPRLTFDIFKFTIRVCLLVERRG